MANKTVGILTFHASHNCGSMLQTYAMQKFLNKHDYQPEIINFASPGQIALYRVFTPNRSLKQIVRNLILLMNRSRLLKCVKAYETFISNYFMLSGDLATSAQELRDASYHAVIAGSDQIWNTTIADYDDAYFLSWVKSAKRIAYAPSFGARNPLKYAQNPREISRWLEEFDALSVREKNGQRWIADMIGKEVPFVLDPTLLLEAQDYDQIAAVDLQLPKKYIFYYAPGYSLKINRLVQKISRKYKMPVIAFNTKSFVLRGMHLTGMQLPEYENPSAYLQLMKNASLVITTSFHGTIFSTIFKKKFWVIKNGGMYGDDDRVASLTDALQIGSRVITEEYNESFDYMQEVDYSLYMKNLVSYQKISQEYLLSALEG